MCLRRLLQAFYNVYEGSAMADAARHCKSSFCRNYSNGTGLCNACSRLTPEEREARAVRAQQEHEAYLQRERRAKEQEEEEMKRVGHKHDFRFHKAFRKGKYVLRKCAHPGCKETQTSIYSD